MKVIFIKDVKGQGKTNEIKEVKPGYGQNFLIKNGYAVVKNKENLLKLQQEQAMKIKEDELAKNKASMLKTKLDKLILEFKVKTGEQDKVFGSISVKQIKDALEKQNYKIDKSQIEIVSPMASLGFHNVNIRLYPGITATIKAHIIK